MDCAVAGKGKIEKSGSKNVKSRITPGSVVEWQLDANKLRAKAQVTCHKLNPKKATGLLNASHHKSDNARLIGMP